MAPNANGHPIYSNSVLVFVFLKRHRHLKQHCGENARGRWYGTPTVVEVTNANDGARPGVISS